MRPMRSPSPSATPATAGAQALPRERAGGRWWGEQALNTASLPSPHTSVGEGQGEGQNEAPGGPLPSQNISPSWL